MSASSTQNNFFDFRTFSVQWGGDSELPVAYEAVRKLGEGSYGRVYLVQRQYALSRTVFKVYRQGIGDTDQMKSATREAHATRYVNQMCGWRNVDRPNFIQYIQGPVHIESPDEDADAQYIVTEYSLVDGENVADVMERYSGFEPLNVATRYALTWLIGSEVARLVRELTRIGVAHHDLKPANIMLVTNRNRPFGYEVYLIDFGLACIRPNVETDVLKDTLEMWGDKNASDNAAEVTAMEYTMDEEFKTTVRALRDDRGLCSKQPYGDGVPYYYFPNRDCLIKLDDATWLKQNMGDRYGLAIMMYELVKMACWATAMGCFASTCDASCPFKMLYQTLQRKGVSVAKTVAETEAQLQGAVDQRMTRLKAVIANPDATPEAIIGELDLPAVPDSPDWALLCTIKAHLEKFMADLFRCQSSLTWDALADRVQSAPRQAILLLDQIKRERDQTRSGTKRRFPSLTEFTRAHADEASPGGFQ